MRPPVGARAVTRPLLLLCFLLTTPVDPVDGRPSTAARQGAGWDAPRVRELMGRAIERRATWTSSGDLHDYQAHARGHVYFMFDLGRNTPRHLVKADQIALDLFWGTPDRTRQVIVGHRDRKILPTDIAYHIDHLTVAMDNFGDHIRLGEGTEVRDALHPAAPGALEFYEYRLTDSLTLVMPDREVQVYRVEVRPRDLRRPGIVGKIHLDRRTADIVQMRFTFTAASYLDRQLDYINVRLDNALWGDGYWLPYRQSLELRREVRALDFPAGGVIRAEFTIGDYRFNAGLPGGFFDGPEVTWAPARVARDYEFREDLFAGLEPSVTRTAPSLDEVQEAATRLVGASYLRRARGFRLAVPGVSSVVRFRRSEGLYVGPGVSRRFGPGLEARLLGGFAAGSDRWELLGSVGLPVDDTWRIRATGYANRSADASPWPASSGAVATLGVLVDGDDYREPYWADGGRLELERDWARIRARLSVHWERWQAAELGASALLSRGYRTVRQVHEGELGALTLSLEGPDRGVVEAGTDFTWQLRVQGATSELAGDFDFVQGRGRSSWQRVTGTWSFGASVEAGVLLGGRLPAQRLLLLGGRGTVRGYPFHHYAGTRYGAIGVAVRREVWRPFLSVHVFADAGWIGAGGDSEALAVWNRRGPAAGATRGAAVGLGGGVGLLFDLISIELARGLNDEGIWELIVATRPAIWSWL